MQDEINHLLEERKYTMHVRQKCLIFFFSNFQKNVMHARKMFNVFLFLFSKIILKKRMKICMQWDWWFFIFKNLKKRICNVCETKKMFNIFYFSNAKMYVMYVRKKCLILFFISIAQNHFFRRKKIYNACRQKCLMFSFSNFRKYVMHDVMHARKILNVFFYFPKSIFKK